MPDAIPTRVTGTDPVSEREAGVPDRPMPMPTKPNASTTTQNEAFPRRQQQHRQETEEDEDIAGQQREAGNRALRRILAERGAARIMKAPANSAGRAASTVLKPSTLCMYCCPMNIAPINAPKTMMPSTAATQNVGRTATLRSYNGFLAWRCPISKQHPGNDRNDEQAYRQLLVTGHGQEVDGQD